MMLDKGVLQTEDLLKTIDSLKTTGLNTLNLDQFVDSWVKYECSRGSFSPFDKNDTVKKRLGEVVRLAYEQQVELAMGLSNSHLLSSGVLTEDQKREQANKTFLFNLIKAINLQVDIDLIRALEKRHDVGVYLGNYLELAQVENAALQYEVANRLELEELATAAMDQWVERLSENSPKWRNEANQNISALNLQLSTLNSSIKSCESRLSSKKEELKGHEVDKKVIQSKMNDHQILKQKIDEKSKEIHNKQEQFIADQVKNIEVNSLKIVTNPLSEKDKSESSEIKNIRKELKETSKQFCELKDRMRRQHALNARLDKFVNSEVNNFYIMKDIIDLKSFVEKNESQHNVEFLLKEHGIDLSSSELADTLSRFEEVVDFEKAIKGEFDYLDLSQHDQAIIEKLKDLSVDERRRLYYNSKELSAINKLKQELVVIEAKTLENPQVQKLMQKYGLTEIDQLDKMNNIQHKLQNKFDGLLRKGDGTRDPLSQYGTPEELLIDQFKTRFHKEGELDGLIQNLANNPGTSQELKQKLQSEDREVRIEAYAEKYLQSYKDHIAKHKEIRQLLLEEYRKEKGYQPNAPLSDSDRKEFKSSVQGQIAIQMRSSGSDDSTFGHFDVELLNMEFKIKGELQENFVNMSKVVASEVEGNKILQNLYYLKEDRSYDKYVELIVSRNSERFQQAQSSLQKLQQESEAIGSLILSLENDKIMCERAHSQCSSEMSLLNKELDGLLSEKKNTDALKTKNVKVLELLDELDSTIEIRNSIKNNLEKEQEKDNPDPNVIQRLENELRSTNESIKLFDTKISSLRSEISNSEEKLNGAAPSMKQGILLEFDPLPVAQKKSKELEEKKGANPAPRIDT